MNHHGKTITVGGNKDSDMDPLVEQVGGKIGEMSVNAAAAPAHVYSM